MAFEWSPEFERAAWWTRELAHPDLEALPAAMTDRFTYDSDLRNSALDDD